MTDDTDRLFDFDEETQRALESDDYQALLRLLQEAELRAEFSKTEMG